MLSSPVKSHIAHPQDPHNGHVHQDLATKSTLHTLGPNSMLRTGASGILTNIIACRTNRILGTVIVVRRTTGVVNAVSFYAEAGKAIIPMAEARFFMFCAGRWEG